MSLNVSLENISDAELAQFFPHHKIMSRQLYRLNGELTLSRAAGTAGTTSRHWAVGQEAVTTSAYIWNINKPIAIGHLWVSSIVEAAIVPADNVTYSLQLAQLNQLEANSFNEQIEGLNNASSGWKPVPAANTLPLFQVHERDLILGAVYGQLTTDITGAIQIVVKFSFQGLLVKLTG